MGLCNTFIHQISSQLNISCKYIGQTIYEFDKFHSVATKPGAASTPKVTERQKRLIKFGTRHYLVRFARTHLNLTIRRQTVIVILICCT